MEGSGTVMYTAQLTFDNSGNAACINGLILLDKTGMDTFAGRLKTVG